MTIEQIAQDCQNWLKEARVETVSPELADELFSEELKELWTALRKKQPLKIADAIIDLYWVAANESEGRIMANKSLTVMALERWVWPKEVNFDLYAKAVSLSNWSKLDADYYTLETALQDGWDIYPNLNNGFHIRDASGKIRKPSTYKDAETIYLELIKTL